MKATVRDDGKVWVETADGAAFRERAKACMKALLTNSGGGSAVEIMHLSAWVTAMLLAATTGAGHDKAFVRDFADMVAQALATTRRSQEIGEAK